MKEVWFLSRCTSPLTVSSSIISRGWDSDNISCQKHMKSPHIFHLMESFPFPPLLSLHRTHKIRTYLWLHCHTDKWLNIFCEMTWHSHNMVGEYIFSMGIQAKITIEIDPTQSPPAPVTHRPRLLCLYTHWGTWLSPVSVDGWPLKRFQDFQFSKTVILECVDKFLTNLTRSESLYPKIALNTITEGSISAPLYC